MKGIRLVIILIQFTGYIESRLPFFDFFHFIVQLMDELQIGFAFGCCDLL
jgi:hypothetical protein